MTPNKEKVGVVGHNRSDGVFWSFEVLNKQAEHYNLSFSYPGLIGLGWCVVIPYELPELPEDYSIKLVPGFYMLSDGILMIKHRIEYIG